MKILNVIGQGSFGKVFRAQDPKTGHIFAIKQFFDNPCEELRREYAILKACQHPRILKCYGSGGGEHNYLILDYFPMDLYTFIREQPQPLPTEVLWSITRQILQAVEYLHNQKRIIHTDIKPGNLLVAGAGANPSVTLCDFASSCVYGSALHKSARGENHGTLWYRAPENFLGPDQRTGLVFGFEMDMWAVGCVLYELVTGMTLVSAKTDHEQFLQLCTFFGTPTVATYPDVKYRRNFKALQKMPTYANRAPAIIKRALVRAGAPREFTDLVLRLLVVDPAQRLTASQALAVVAVPAKNN